MSTEERRTNRWVQMVCTGCGGRRFNILRHDEQAEQTVGELECNGCGRVIRVTICEIAPSTVDLKG